MSDELDRFFDLLYGRLPPDHLGGLWCLPSKLSDHIPVGATEVLAGVARAHAPTSDVYYAVCPRAPERDPGPQRRGGKRDVSALPALFLDVDVSGPGHAAENLPPSPAEALALFDFMPEPSVVVFSGGGVQPLWVLEDPRVFGAGYGGEARAVEKVLKQLGKMAAERAASRGWHFDHEVCELARVLRCPYTVNRKAGLERPTTVVRWGARHRWADLEKIIVPSTSVAVGAPEGDAVREQGRDSQAQPASPTPHPAPSGAPTTTDLGPLADNRPRDVAWCRERIKNVRGAAQRAKIERILRGEPIAPRGRRDSELQSVVSIVAWRTGEADVETVLDLLQPSLDAMLARDGHDPDNPCPDRETAREKLLRARGDLVGWTEKREAERREWVEMLSEQARKVGAPAPRVDDEPLPPTPSAKYTQEELELWAQEQGCSSVDEFLHRLIIQRETGHYVFCNGDYLPPVTTAQLELTLRQYLAPVDQVRWWRSNSKGDLRPATAKEIVADHATAALAVRADMTAERGGLDVASGTFTEVACRRRPLRPVYHEKIDTWLRLLGGASQEKLLDWIACVTRQDRQCAALYLAGVGNAGKGMLAQGLAKLWQTGSFVELARVLDGFNEDLTKSPLVFVDEKMPERWRGDRGSAELRAFIATDHRTLARKFLPNVELKGAVRLILAANNKNLLAFNEELTLEDVAAIAARFLVVHVNHEPTDYLVSLGGRRGTHDWVDGCKIAEHALWLRDNRAVSEGSRFIVEGDVSSVIQELVMRPKIPSLICEWLVRHLSTPISHVQQQGGVLAGLGKLRVDPRAIADSWDNYIKSDKVPTTARIGRTLANWTQETEEIGGRVYRVVDPAPLYQWAEENVVGDVRQMRRQVDGPLVLPSAVADAMRGNNVLPFPKPEEK